MEDTKSWPFPPLHTLPLWPYFESLSSLTSAILKMFLSTSIFSRDSTNQLGFNYVATNVKTCEAFPMLSGESSEPQQVLQFSL